MALDTQNVKQMAWDAWFHSAALAFRTTMGEDFQLAEDDERQNEVMAKFEDYFNTRGLDLIKRLTK